MMWFRDKDAKKQMDAVEKLEAKVTAAVREILGKALSETETVLGKLKTSFDLAKHVVDLKEQIETLRIEKARKDEDFARREREVEHKVGLERKRQAFEIDQAKREALVGVKEENLASDKKRFEEQMRFHQERFEKEVGYLQTIMSDILKRLPTQNTEIKVLEKR